MCVRGLQTATGCCGWRAVLGHLPGRVRTPCTGIAQGPGELQAALEAALRLPQAGCVVRDPQGSGA